MGLTFSIKESGNVLLFVPDIAQHLGVSKDIIYAWSSEDKNPTRRVGKFWRFQISEVDEWVTSGNPKD